MSESEFDPSDFAIGDGEQGSPPDRPRFYRMPSPPPFWGMAAGALPGRAYRVAQAVWLAYHVTKKPTFHLTRRWFEWFPMHRESRYEGLARLEEAGLVSVERVAGMAPLVTVIHTERDLADGWSGILSPTYKNN